jgi:hypothetical protein
MKLLTCLLFIIPIIGFNQITISKNDFPSSGDEYIYSNANTNGIDVSLTGVNVSWDYSQLISVSYDSLTYVTVGSTPFAYQLYFNIPFSPYKADYAIKGNEVNAFNQVTITDVFDFHKKNNSSIEMVGFGANINGVPASIKYDTIDQLYPLPMTFGTTDSTSAYYLLDIPTLGAYGQHIQRKVEVDGWGEIITPYQTYNQCLRVKTTLYQRDTLKAEQPFPLPGVAFNRPVQTRYEWFASGIGAPVFSVTKQGNTTSNAKYMDVNTTSIGEATNHFEFTVFPNPVKEVLELSIPFENAKIIITDLSGKVVYSGAFKQQLNLTDLKSGNYIITIVNGEKTASKVIQKL